jgi:hypothetical protein
MIGNGTLKRSAGPWRPHWCALLGTVVRDGVVVATLWAVALYAGWPWLLMLALLAFAPSLLAGVRWCCRRVYLTPTELVMQSGVVNTCAVSFPFREIDMFEARQTLAGKLFDYGDLAVCAGPNAQGIERLHPFGSFMTAYQARWRAAAGWPEADRRWRPAPPFAPLPEPRPREPRREEDRVVNGRVRRLEGRSANERR